MKAKHTYEITRGSLTSSKKKDDRDLLISAFNQDAEKPLDHNNINEVLESKNKEFQNLSKEDQQQVKKEIGEEISQYSQPFPKEKKKRTPYIFILLISLFFLLLILFTLSQ